MSSQITNHSHAPSTPALTATHPDKLVSSTSFPNYNSTIRHIHGMDNVVADALSRIEFNTLLTNQPLKLDFIAMAHTQATG